MPRVEFRLRETGRLVAHTEAADNAVIPIAGDRVYAPSATDAGVYSHYQVSDRELYYDQEGRLALIKLECFDVPSTPAHTPNK